MNDAEITLPGYPILRCDRADGRKQGGALLVATPRFELRRVPTPDHIDVNKYKFELVCAAVYNTNNRFLFTCCVVYIPPHADENEYTIMFKLLEDICIRYKNNVIILGDFNLFSSNIQVCNYYEYFVAFCELAQYNEVPNCNDRQLDLVLSGRGTVTVRMADEALEPVDGYHPPLAVAVPLGASCASPASCISPASPASDTLSDLVDLTDLTYFRRWNFNKADFHQLYNLIAIEDWTEIYNLSDPETVLNLFYAKITNIFDACIRARVKSETAIAHDTYRDRVQSHLAKDPQAFWSYMRSKKGNINQNKLVKNGRILPDRECADEFASFFHSVYNSEPAKLSVAAADAAGGASAARVELGNLSPDAVVRALERLPPKRSVGPDGIPPFIFKDCRKVLVEPLLHVFNTCIATATFPDRWKLTRVVPVPKGRGGSEPSDYRPVAVLCTPAKVFESAVHNSLYEQVSAQLSDAQHGFRPGRGTTGNLLHLMTRLVPAVDAGVQVDVAYFDFRKAFDTVDNDVLLAKLARVGCTPKTLAFFASYLRDRRQYVDCGGHRSEPYYTRSGVSQGSNLGPLQFILMVNDLPEVVTESTCLLFADDLKLVMEVGEISDHDHRLQRDIDAVSKWSQENKLHFNVSKCSVMTFSRARAPRHHQYQLEGQTLRRVTEVRDLGIQFSADLNFRKHVADTCKRAYRNLGFVLRQANAFTNIKALRALYEALVKSHLECNASIWSPGEAKYKVMLERIQNKFLRFMYLKLYGVYPGYPLLYPTLFVMGMVGYSTLELRREVSLAAYIFKVLRGKVHNPAVLKELRFCVPNDSGSRRRRPPLLAQPRARTCLLQRLARSTRSLNTSTCSAAHWASS
nr:uncharacterized protein LOC117992047 [Maniola hyperantus]